MKATLKVMFVLSVITIMATQAYAQDKSATSGNESSKATSVKSGCNFVDNNKNGTCDNWEARHQGVKGRNYTDKNGDGICDNRQTTSGGKGQGYCFGAGKGNCCKNGNGSGNCCGAGKGNGMGCQHRHGWGNQPVNTSEPLKK